MAVDPLVKLVEINEKFAADAKNRPDFFQAVAGDCLSSTIQPTFGIENEMAKSRYGQPVIARQIWNLIYRRQASALPALIVMLHIPLRDQVIAVETARCHRGS